MRSCRHCAHENADHLAFCSQCGRKLPRTDGGLPVVSRRTTGDPGGLFADDAGDAGPRIDDGAGHSRRRAHAVRQAPVERHPAWASAGRPRRRPPVSCALAGRVDRLHLRLPAQQAGRGRAPAAAARGTLGRGDAAGRRAQRARADRAARRDPARRADGIARGDRAGARAARGGGRRRGDVGIAAAERGDAARRTSSRTPRPNGPPPTRRAASQSRSCARRPAIAARRARVWRASRTSGRGSNATPATRAVPSATPGSRSWRTTPPGSRRSSARWKRTPNGSTRSSRTCAPRPPRCATPPRRRSRSWIRSSPDAGRRRPRWRRASRDGCAIAVDAEREIADLTAQIGRVAADVRPPHAALLSAYQNIDRLTETISTRSAHLAAIEQARSHYDHRKLLAGLGLVTCMLVVISAALWKLLK